MKTKKRLGINGIIVPTFIEPNGKMEKFLKVARNPGTRKEYERLLRELKARPETFGRKLREAVWKGKTVDEIAAVLDRERNR